MTKDEIIRAIVPGVRLGEYNLLLGAAASLGSTDADGSELPLADDFRLSLCALKKAKPTNSLQRIFGTLSHAEIAEHVTKPFSNASPGPTLQAIPTFVWKRIFTLNIDDALERAYEEAESYQNIIPQNYCDPLVDHNNLADISVIHLHGTVTKPKEGYIFSRNAYVKNINSQNPWMIFLTETLSVDPFIIIGSSLDEVDIDYYLSMRSKATIRSDKGLSVLVEPFGDVVTDADCERYGLVKFAGKADEFIAMLRAAIESQPNPVELISPQGAKLFPPGVDTNAVGAFLSDFEVVPAAAAPNRMDRRFLRGAPASWTDFAADLDIPRQASSTIVEKIYEFFADNRIRPGIVYLSDVSGGGKSTVLDRLAFDFARRDFIVLKASAIGRFSPKLAASMIDLIDGKVLIFVDNIADHINVLAQTVRMIEKTDVLFVITDREYRQKFVESRLGDISYIGKYSPELSSDEIKALIAKYFNEGMVGGGEVARPQGNFVRKLSGDPIAIASCRILNDFKPFDRVLDGIFADIGGRELTAYLSIALATDCLSAGLAYSLAANLADGQALRALLADDCPIGISHSELGKNYVASNNRSVGFAVLSRCRSDDPDKLFRIYKDLALAIAPRVNIHAIRRRSPEARLAGTLLDLDLKVQPYLGDRALDLYDEIQTAWEWNSRYWCQKALVRHQQFLGNPVEIDGIDKLEFAVSHASQAVSIENHPLPLTTLGRVLLTRMEYVSGSCDADFDHAFVRLSEAIRREKSQGRRSVQPYVVLLRGVSTYFRLGGRLSERQASEFEAFLGEAARYFGSDPEVQPLLESFERD